MHPAQEPATGQTAYAAGTVTEPGRRVRQMAGGNVSGSMNWESWSFRGREVHVDGAHAGTPHDSSMSGQDADAGFSPERALHQLEARIAVQPDDLTPRRERADLLALLGQTKQAAEAYQDILARAPTHYATLNNLGTLLYENGSISAARAAYTAAIAAQPQTPVAYANLANLLFYCQHYASSLVLYQSALKLDPGHIKAHQGLAVLFQHHGNAAIARHHRDLAYAQQPLEHWPYIGSGPATEILVLTSSICGTLPWRPLVDRSVFRATSLAVEYSAEDQPLPPHALVFNAISDADSCRPALIRATALLAGTSAPVINRPSAVLKTSRLDNAARLRNIAGVTTPRMALLARSDVQAAHAATLLADMGFAFPLLVRSPGYQNGQHFVRVESSAELAAAVSRLPGAQLLIMEFLDARCEDGLTRKYRVMCIDRRLRPLHLAISSTWKVHYFSSQMKGNPAHQAEEAAFLTDMPRVLGPRASASLERIMDVLDLDYGGMDFFCRADGEVLLFEANATMLIKLPGPDEQWDYRRAPIEATLAAARALLTSRIPGRESGQIANP